MAEANQTALETARTNSSVDWVNPDTGNRGSVTPTRTYQSASGVCREFTNTVYVGGRSEQAYGTACRQSDGSWKIIQ
jgi:surface antigen